MRIYECHMIPINQCHTIATGKKGEAPVTTGPNTLIIENFSKNLAKH